MVATVTVTVQTSKHCSAYGVSDGFVTATASSNASGSLTYLWSNGATLPYLKNVPAGSYTVTVTNASQSVSTTSSAAVVFQPLSLSFVSTPTSGNNRTIAVTAAGGNGSTYAYSWTMNSAAIASSTATITGLLNAMYTCKVTSTPYSALISIPTTVLTVITAPTSMTILYPYDANAVRYQLKYKLSTAANYTEGANGQTSNTITIGGLAPSKSYNIVLTSYTAANVPTVVTTQTVSTQSDSIGNYAKSTLPTTSTGAYDIQQINTAITKGNIINSAFVLGDAVKIPAKTSTSASKIVTAEVVPLNATLPIKKSTAMYCPFDAVGASTQTVNVTLSNATSQTVSYSTSKPTSITYMGTTYPLGSKFVLDGQQVTVATD
jgi:hypothetical protein